MYGLGDWNGELEKKNKKKKSRLALPHLKRKTAYTIHVLSYLGLSIYQM